MCWTRDASKIARRSLPLRAASNAAHHSASKKYYSWYIKFSLYNGHNIKDFHSVLPR